LPLPVFLAQAGAPGVGERPAVSFVDPNFGRFGITGENDEHPPSDIQRGQAGSPESPPGAASLRVVL
jgi:hypothetical protein